MGEAGRGEEGDHAGKEARQAPDPLDVENGDLASRWVEFDAVDGQVVLDDRAGRLAVRSVVGD